MSEIRPGAFHAQPTAPADDEGEVNLLEYWRVLIERRAVVLTILASVVVAVTLFTFLSTPKYQATTTLQIERQGPEILTYKDVLGVDQAAYQDFYQTQYKILQSRAVVRLAIQALDLPNVPEFASRKGSPIGRLFRWVRSGLGGGGEEADDPLLPAIKFLENGLSVQPIRNSHLVKVSFTDRSPELARDVANALVDAYQQFSLETRYGTTAQATEFLTKEVARIQAEIASAERKLQEYGLSKQLISVGESSKDISEQALADLNSRLTDARGRLAVAEARFRALQHEPPESLAEVLNSPLISSLKQQHAEVERRHSQMTERFKPDWPAMQQVQEEMDQARERLELETLAVAEKVRGVARADYERSRAEVETLQTQVDLQKQEVQRVNRENIAYASLKAEIDTKRKVLTDLVARQSETATSERLRDTQTSNIRVVDLAELPRKPVSPKKLLNLALSLALGLLLGIGMAFLLDYLDSTVKSEQDIERASALPILGNIPLFQPLRVVQGTADASEAKPPPVDIDLASHTDPRSIFAEAFKNLRTSLLLASPDRPARHIVVTSCEPGDGKSTVTLNLGIALTQLGRRVLIIDGDLRKPRLHRMLHTSNAVGLSNYLSGNADVDDLIQHTPVPSLDAIVSGPIPPNPSELLGSPRLTTLVELFDREERYDHILIDSPPCIQVADGIILSSKMDATIVVVRAGKTERVSLTQGVQRLRQTRGHVVGAVLNAVAESGGYYYYRYRYYRHYGETEPSASAEGKRRRRVRSAGSARG